MFSPYSLSTLPNQVEKMGKKSANVDIILFLPSFYAL